MIFSIAWRNVWRNKLRSFVIIFALILGMFAGVFAAAFMKGSAEQRIRNAIQVEGLTHIQIHHKEFRENTDLHKYITNSDKIVNEIAKQKDVQSVSQRIVINTLAATAKASTGVQVWGVQPQNEKEVATISNNLIDGKYFEGVKRNPIVIGEKLAEKLKVKLRSKIIIKFMDIDGNQMAGAFKVAGIYRTSNTMYDEMTVFAQFDDVAKLINLPNNTAHEIAILLKNKKLTQKNIDSLSEQYSEYEALPWQELSPFVGFMDEMMDMYMYIFIVIILFTLCFGIINTMLMAVMERVKELGMLMAVGMNKGKVFRMIMLETVFLVLTGGAIGILLGIAAIEYSSIHGLDLGLWGEGLNALGYDSVIFPYLDITMTANIIALVILTGILSSIYPARKALKQNPADALRTE